MSSALDILRRDEALFREGVQIVVDRALKRPLRSYVDVAVLLDAVSDGFGEKLVARVVREHLMPARERVASELGELRVEQLLPPSMQPALEELVATMPLPAFSWMSGAIDKELVKELLAPVWQEIFGGFAKSFGAIGQSIGGAARGLAGALSRMGQSVSRGVDKDGKVQGAIADFSEGVTGRVKDAIVQRVQSDEGRVIVEKMRRQVHARILETPATVILEDLERMPLDSLLALMPAVVADNAASELGRRIVRREVEAVLAIEGDRSVSEILEEAGTLPLVRAYLRVSGEALLRELLDEDEAFAAWIERWLSAVTDREA